MKFQLILLAVCIAVVIAKKTKEEKEAKWNHVKGKHGLKFNDNAEEEKRKAKFFENDDLIEEHNQKNSEYQLSHNEISESDGEFHKRKGFIPRNVLRKRAVDRFNTPADNYVSTGVTLPASVDWSATKYNTSVKNQKTCGCCWAFSAAAAIEAQYAIYKNKTIDLSEQQLIDCATQSWGNYGCNGGDPESAMSYVYQKKGQEEEKAYPFAAIQHSTCSTNSTAANYSIAGVHFVGQNEASLKQAVALLGPVSVAIDAGPDTFNLYSSGIWDGKWKNGTLCSAANINHAVLLVGYGTTSTGVNYWKIKNQWGTTWGEAGYIRLKMDGTNICGIYSYARTPYL